MPKPTPLVEESTALAIIEQTPTDLATGVSQFSTTPDFAEDDISWPRLKLLQGISPEVMDPDSSVKAGTWFITGDESGRKEVAFIPLGFNLTRRYEVGEKDDKVTLCLSTDGKTGVAQAPAGPGGPCNICPLAKWQENPETGRRLLACQPSYHYVGYVPDFGIVSLTLSRTATQTAKILNGFLQMRGFGGFGVRFTASQVKTADKIYFVPVMKLAKVEAEELANARMMMAN